jgi:hypothetical protein
MKRTSYVALLTAMVLCASLSCTSTAPLVDGFVAARARVSGRVLRPDGTPLAQVLVTVHLPDSVYRMGYQYQSATTESDGRFQAAEVLRLTIARPLGGLDTLTAYVVATASGGFYKAGTGGAYPTDSTSVVIRFYDSRQEPVPTAAIVRVTVP